MNDEKCYDRRFLTMIGTPDLRLVDVTGSAAEGQRQDVRRIASTLFCSAGIDPSIVAFAIDRTAAHWGLTAEEVDLRVTRRLVQKATSLLNDLRWLTVQSDASDAPSADDPVGFPAITAA